MKRTRTLLPALFAVITLLSAAVGCTQGRSDQTESQADSSAHRFPDTLRVVTLYSPASYFIYKGQEMGYDYELVTALAVDKGLTLKVDIATSLSRAIEMLDSGKVDLIAYEVPITAEYKEKVVACGP